jgi:hypothetical protein
MSILIGNFISFVCIDVCKLCMHLTCSVTTIIQLYGFFWTGIVFFNLLCDVFYIQSNDFLNSYVFLA